MNGYWYNSAMTYGVSSSDVELDLKEDRSVYRYQSQVFGQREVELAFKSDATGRYDDLYYTITPKTKRIAGFNINDAESDDL